MTITLQTTAPPVLVARAQVRRTERISSAFQRITLESPAFADLGVDGFDTRFKMIFPGATGQLPAIPAHPEEWYASWLAMPEAVRGPMRTYTVRDVVEEDGARLLVVDLVVHERGPRGPACRWAQNARPGDTLQVVAPHRGSREYGGTEFDPGGRTDLLLVADETAVPALTRILADLGPTCTGHAFVEVPAAADILTLDAPAGVEVSWLVRRDAEHGRGLVREVRRYLGLRPLDPALLPTEITSGPDVGVWETPRFSSSGEDVRVQPQRPCRTVGSSPHDLYAWIAGESWLVKALRRTLVTELQVDRRQVAFMGYWRQGVAMRS